MTATAMKIYMLLEQLPEQKQDTLLTIVQGMIETENDEADLDEMIDVDSLKAGVPVTLGGWEGLISMSDDFDAPLDDFEEYM